MKYMHEVDCNETILNWCYLFSVSALCIMYLKKKIYKVDFSLLTYISATVAPLHFPNTRIPSKNSLLGNTDKRRSADIFSVFSFTIM